VYQMADVFLTREQDQRRLVVSARDVRAAFEAALRAMLSVADSDANSQAESTRSVPFRGEGRDLARLFLDMLADLDAQLDIHGYGWVDVTVDGVLRNNDGGYVGWGYVHGSFAGEPGSTLPELLEPPSVDVEASGAVVIRVTLLSR
jgi:hypothetical protein